jgi:hypothetical protein
MKLMRFSRKPKEAEKAPYVKPPERELKKFKQKRQWVMIIEYREGIKRDGVKIQKFGFTADDFKDASERAESLARTIGKALATRLKEIQKTKMARVLAIYEATAFKDWENEKVPTSNNDHVKDAIKRIAKISKPTGKTTTKVTVR